MATCKDETCPKCGRVDIAGFQCWRVGHLPATPDPRDAEIARLKAEVERLRESEADLIQWIFDGGQRAGIEPADLSPTEVLTRMSDDLDAHKRALAAGPAALHYRSCDCCSIVEAAQAEAMKEKP